MVIADARGVAFQWKFNGTDIPGATGDSLLLTNVSAAKEGQYSVLVTNSAGSVTSAPAALMLDNDGDGLPDTWEKANFTDPDPITPSILPTSAAQATRMATAYQTSTSSSTAPTPQGLRPCGHG